MLLNGKIAGETAKEINADIFTKSQFQMIRLLCEMAKEDVYPNANFSDDECNIWSMFRECVRK